MYCAYIRMYTCSASNMNNICKMICSAPLSLLQEKLLEFDAKHIRPLLERYPDSVDHHIMSTFLRLQYRWEHAPHTCCGSDVDCCGRMILLPNWGSCLLHIWMLHNRHFTPRWTLSPAKVNHSSGFHITYEFPMLESFLPCSANPLSPSWPPHIASNLAL